MLRREAFVEFVAWRALQIMGLADDIKNVIMRNDFAHRVSKTSGVQSGNRMRHWLRKAFRRAFGQGNPSLG